jgi:small conductance mechanosensitive channel
VANLILSFPPLSVSAPAPPFDALRAEAHSVLSGDPEAWRHTLDAASGLAVNLVVAVLILILTLWLSSWIAKVTRRTLERIQRPAAPDATLLGFLSSAARGIVLIIGAIAVLQRLGVQTTSILTLLGAGSLAIGLAMQGSLSNVAAGVMLLVLRPYRIGDVVAINGHVGTVKRLDLFMTELTDLDNLAIFMPNGKVFGEMIVNYSTPRTRRIELTFGVDYEDDLDRAEALLLQCAKADARVLAEPAPWAAVTALEASSVTLTLRVWTINADAWDVRYALIKKVKQTLEAAGLRFPYPHQVAVEKPAPAAPTAPAQAK